MIKIIDCKEPLVDLNKNCPGLVTKLDYRRKIFYLRKTVAKMVCQAKTYLPRGITFIINDAWRSQQIQKEIFESFIKKAQKMYPKAANEKIIRFAKKYVAPFKGKYASGHLTGAAVDLRLFKNGRKLPMISKKLTYQQNALSNQTGLPKYIQNNRQIMFEALKKAGLSNYPKEYWHWSYGDIQWAKRNKKKIAIYGVIKSI